MYINDMRVRAVGFMHAFVVSIFCLAILLGSGMPSAVRKDPYANHPPSAMVFSIALGYFVWDLFTCIYCKWDYGYWAHAIACMFVYGASLYPFLHYWGLFFLLFELSTPLLHLRWFAIAAKMPKKNPLLFNIIQYSFAGLFFLTRIVMGLTASAIWWGEMVALLQSGAHNTAVGVGYMACNIVLNLLNVYWFSLMIKSVLSGGRAAHREGSADLAHLAAGSDAGAATSNQATSANS